MATITITPGRYPVGTVLDVFKYHDASRRPGSMSAVTTATAQATPVVVPGLISDTEYVIGTEINGVWRGTKARSTATSGVLDRAYDQAAAELAVAGVGIGNEAKLAELTLAVPYAGAIYDVSYSAGVTLSHGAATVSGAGFRFKLDGADINATDANSMVVADSAFSGAVYERTFARDFQVTVPTVGAHLLSVWGWRTANDLSVLLRRHRTFKALCYGA